MKVSKKMAGMIAAITVICAMGSGPALAAKAAENEAVAPTMVSSLGSFFIKICDNLGKIAAYRSSENEKSPADTSADATYTVAAAVETNAAALLPGQQEAQLGDYVISIAKADEETGNILVSTDGGETWEVVSSKTAKE